MNRLCKNKSHTPVVVICLDGVSWEYIMKARTPFLDEISREGTSATCQAMVPTVTNVNNASITTGAFPDKHGISTNWYYDPLTGLEMYMDSSDFLTCSTILEKKTACGFKTILLTVKDKLRRLLARNVTASYSVEKPSSKIRKKGLPPPIYSLESSPWLLSAAEHELSRRHWDMAYISTTDYIPHMFAPGKPEAKEYISRLDEGLRRIAELDVILGVVADHGMNEKKVNIDLEKLLDEAGIKSRFVASIKDEHVIHHKNLGGSAFLYVNGDIDRATDIIDSVEGVESVYTKCAASRKFRLPIDRIGDILVMADINHTFGPNHRSIYSDIDIRSHGCLHECEVPFILSRKVEMEHELYNKDLIPVLLQGLL